MDQTGHHWENLHRPIVLAKDQAKVEDEAPAEKRGKKRDSRGTGESILSITNPNPNNSKYLLHALYLSPFWMPISLIPFILALSIY